MHRLSRILASRLLTAGLCAGLSALPLLAQVSVRSVKVLGTKDVVEIEVEATDRIVPQTQVLTGPDRLVIDFPNAVPSGQVRSQSVDRGEVKDVRVGLFHANPPVTRVVLDLKTAQSYQVFPSGRTVMIKVVGGSGASVASAGANDFTPPAKRPGLVVANYTTRSEPVQLQTAPQPPLVVSYRNGLLAIHSNKATLSEVLYAVQQRTGADISIAAGAEQEKVVAEIEPAPAPEVLAHLLNGSRFNFLILSAPSDPTKLDRVILSTRTDSGFVAPPAPVQAQDADDAADDEPAVVRNQPQENVAPPPPIQTASRPEAESKGQGDENVPDPQQ